ncbi:hypothetical protein BH09BAC3_BH09BAC3_21350 [soil metagenome]
MADSRTLAAILTMTVDTNKLIKKIVKEKFIGQGIKQKGQSRLWYYLVDYYLILVEFQPSSWDKGSYLNVGVDFLWYPKDFFAFEFGDRLSSFKRFVDEKQFETEVEELCDLAISKVNHYKKLFSDKKSVADKLLKLHRDKSNDWEKFAIGLSFALAGQNSKAIDYLKKVIGDNYKHDWEFERSKIAIDYIKAIEKGTFSTFLHDTVDTTKKLLKVS